MVKKNHGSVPAALLYGWTWSPGRCRYACHKSFLQKNNQKNRPLIKS